MGDFYLMGIVDRLGSLIQSIDNLNQEGGLSFSSEEKSILNALGQGLTEAVGLVQPDPAVEMSKFVKISAEGNKSGAVISETIGKALGEGLYVSVLV
jgi:hypothetical protein